LEQHPRGAGFLSTTPKETNVKAFKFEIKQPVIIDTSGETGIVQGRAQYANSENSYLVRYKAGDGRAAEVWWTEDALLAA
jgi:hypothetical protein